MDIRTGDYVTLKSIEGVKPFYKFWVDADNGCVNTETDFFTNEILDAIETFNRYKVVGVNPDDVWVDVEGTIWGFEKKCIKDVYRLTKVN